MAMSFAERTARLKEMPAAGSRESHNGSVERKWLAASRYCELARLARPSMGAQMGWQRALSAGWSERLRILCTLDCTCIQDCWAIAVRRSLSDCSQRCLGVVQYSRMRE